MFKTSFFTNQNTLCQLGALAQGLAKLQNFLLKTGTAGYAVGNTLTIADLRLLAQISFLGSGFFDGIAANFADRFTRIKSIRQNIAARHQSIKTYYEDEKNRFDQMYQTQLASSHEV